ncbi:adenylyltransferase/cytidyltransferase family protein [Streptomyces sp. NPDC051243]|uniref:adenylyltransferase/cytidyltransferase family protein n=1 Tax=Streptomyces sp. NPDC051243 TaxID=3365646 RepID=UPI00379B2527
MMGERLGYAPGVFDLFHVGHLNILRRAREHCDRLIAGVCTDDLVVRLKGRPPVVPLSERLEIVSSVRYVDETFVATVDNKLEIWREIGFDVIFKGDDWLGTDLWTTLEAEFSKVGVEVVYFPYTRHTSSTLLRDALSLIAQRAVPADKEILTSRE